MSHHVKTYKCRICGVVESCSPIGETFSQESALKWMDGHFLNGAQETVIHACKNGDMGVADFIGFTLEG